MDALLADWVEDDADENGSDCHGANDGVRDRQARPTTRNGCAAAIAHAARVGVRSDRCVLLDESRPTGVSSVD